MIYLHKLLPLLLAPLVIVIGLTLYGTLKRRRWVIISAVTLLYLASMPIVARTLFRLIEGPAYRVDPSTLPKADAIIVLSGMLVGVQSPKGIVYEWSDPDRFFGGLELYKLARADKLIFTAGRTPWQDQTEPEGEILKKFAESMGIPQNAILVTDEVQNTEDEAKAVRRLLRMPNPSVLLVTSAFHVMRATQVFANEGLEVTPYPVDYKVESGSTTPMDFLPSASALASSDLVVREQLGRMYYKLKIAVKRRLKIN